ncbi:MAG: 3-oxoacyl-ACP reductase FabG [Clostridia bacterium]|nr:3-oxoacyl-ACP reductase FabG [Clostridia bacterium]
MNRVLISGGSRGIGAAIVRAFARQGDAVAFLYRENHAAAEAIARETGAIAIPCDISDPTAVREATKAAIKALGGPIDVLVNNAGMAKIGLSRDMTDAEWRQICDTNLTGAFCLCREVQAGMIVQSKGRIINIGSMWGKTGASCEVAYSATKAGLRGLTMALAKELGPSGITVNCVEPGVIDTEMNRMLDAESRAALIEETPLCRIGTPQDVAAAVVFLASEQASFITGQCLGVDGGFAI